MNGFNRPYVGNLGRDFTPIYMPLDTYSFYLNPNIVIDDYYGRDPINGNHFGLYLLDADSNIVHWFGGTSQLLVTAGLYVYHIYMESFTFPIIHDGQYFFMVYNDSLGVEMCRTDAILVSSDPYTLETTTTVRFRHNDQLYGYRYDLLPNFYHMYRLPLNQIKSPDIRADRTQFRQSSNGRELRNSKSFRDIYVTIEMWWANDEDFQALSAMLDHTDIWIADNKVIDMTQVKVEKPNEKSNLSKGTFDVIVNEYAENEDDLIYYGEFVSVGGNTFGNYTTFIDGNNE